MAPVTRDAVLALDFDGVICDSRRECATVSWAGQHGWSPLDFDASTFRSIPEPFRRRFRELRGYARSLGHFLVAVRSSGTITSRRDFDAVYRTIPEREIAGFIGRVTDYRGQIRRNRPESWLALHQVYRGVRPLVETVARSGYIVTARDVRSVVDLIGSFDVEIDPDRVFGDRTEKLGALAAIATREEVERDRVHLVDDSLDNVFDARGAGYGSSWAGWGYSTTEHRIQARTMGVTPLSIEQAARRLDLGSRT